ncbi:MAG: hydroxyacid dehydrogenase [Spirochaetales bacterium]
MSFIPIESIASPANLISHVSDSDFILTSWAYHPITREVVEACTSLKLIGHAAGSVKNIVASEVFDRGIVVVNAAEPIARFVAEMALGFAIGLIRKIYQNSSQMKSEGAWRGELFKVDSLYEQSVGLVGLGLTARKFIQLLTPLNVKLYGYDPYISPQTAQSLGVTLLDLDDLLEQCRIVSLHAALLPETRHLIDGRRLKLLRDGAILINTARGGLIDEQALYEELKTGRISAGLDSFESEPLSPDSPLRHLGEHTILTPHMSGPAYYRRWELGKHIVQQIRNFIQGEELQVQVRKHTLNFIA